MRPFRQTTRWPGFRVTLRDGTEVDHPTARGFRHERGEDPAKNYDVVLFDSQGAEVGRHSGGQWTNVYSAYSLDYIRLRGLRGARGVRKRKRLAEQIFGP